MIGGGTIEAMAFIAGAWGRPAVKRRATCVVSARKALLVVDHGSRRKEANDMLLSVREMILGLNPQVDIVEIAHMELAEPTIESGIGRCVEQGAEEIVVVPYFLAPGRHSSKDIPEMVQESAASRPDLKVTVAPPLGLDSKICQVLLERAGL